MPMKNLRWIPGTIVKVAGPISYEVELRNRARVRRHVDNMRRSRGGSRISNRGVLFVQMRAKILKPHPFSCVFTSSQSRFTAATDLWISNLAKVSESTLKHDSTS